MDVKPSIEFSCRHGDTDEKMWEATTIVEPKEGQPYEETCPAVAPEDVSMGQILDTIANLYQTELDKNDSRIVSYDIIKLERVNKCICCGERIGLNEPYCDRHKAVIAQMQQEWNELVNGR